MLSLGRNILAWVFRHLLTLGLILLILIALPPIVSWLKAQNAASRAISTERSTLAEAGDRFDSWSAGAQAAARARVEAAARGSDQRLRTAARADRPRHRASALGQARRPAARAGGRRRRCRPGVRPLSRRRRDRAARAGAPLHRRDPGGPVGAGQPGGPAEPSARSAAAGPRQLRAMARRAGPRRSPEPAAARRRPQFPLPDRAARDRLHQLSRPRRRPDRARRRARREPPGPCDDRGHRPGGRGPDGSARQIGGFVGRSGEPAPGAGGAGRAGRKGRAAKLDPLDTAAGRGDVAHGLADPRRDHLRPAGGQGAALFHRRSARRPAAADPARSRRKGAGRDRGRACRGVPAGPARTGRPAARRPRGGPEHAPRRRQGDAMAAQLVDAAEQPGFGDGRSCPDPAAPPRPGAGLGDGKSAGGDRLARGRARIGADHPAARAARDRPPGRPSRPDHPALASQPVGLADAAIPLPGLSRPLHARRPGIARRPARGGRSRARDQPGGDDRLQRAPRLFGAAERGVRRLSDRQAGIVQRQLRGRAGLVRL